MTCSFLAEIFEELKDSQCLFVFDNVTEDLTVSDLLSSSKNHFILITSRLQKLNADVKPFELGLFTKEEAVEYLQENILSKDISALEELTEKLQYLPLAMGQAVACINQLDLKVQDYLQELDNKRTGSDPGILATWKVSIDRISAEDSGDVATDILDAISYVYPDHIPRSLFNQGNADSTISGLNPFEC